MAQYKFNKDWWGGTYVPPGSQMATRRVEFKQGDVVEGTFVHVETQSESDYVQVNSPQGTVRIPFGGRAGSPLDLVRSGQGSRPAAKGVAETGLFTKKNIIIAVVVIVIIVAVIYFIKRKKIA